MPFYVFMIFYFQQSLSFNLPDLLASNAEFFSDFFKGMSNAISQTETQS